jgi:hypothetical protein
MDSIAQLVAYQTALEPVGRVQEQARERLVELSRLFPWAFTVVQKHRWEWRGWLPRRVSVSWYRVAPFHVVVTDTGTVMTQLEPGMELLSLVQAVEWVEGQVRQRVARDQAVLWQWERRRGS